MQQVVCRSRLPRVREEMDHRICCPTNVAPEIDGAAPGPLQGLARYLRPKSEGS
jgi:hypothetical protein